MSTTIAVDQLGDPGTWQYLWAVPQYAENTTLESTNRQIQLSLWVGSSPPSFRVNQFTWPAYPSSGIRLLSQYRAVAGRPGAAELPIILDKDPNNQLDKISAGVAVPATILVTQEASCKLISDNFPHLFNSISGFLSAISMKFNHPLEIHHITALDTATGIQWTRYRVPTKDIVLQNLSIGPFGAHFQQVISLFREGITSPNPAYQVLSFYKVSRLVLGENGIEGIRPRVNALLKQHGISDLSRPKEFIDGNTYGEVLDSLAPERNRIGHGILSDGTLRSPDNWDDLNLLWDIADKLRLIAWNLLMQEEAALARLGDLRGNIGELP